MRIAASWIPRILPMFAHVAQAPIMRPRFFFENQFPSMWMLDGHRIEENRPIMKNIT